MSGLRLRSALGLLLPRTLSGVEGWVIYVQSRNIPYLIPHRNNFFVVHIKQIIDARHAIFHRCMSPAYFSSCCRVGFTVSVVSQLAIEVTNVAYMWTLIVFHYLHWSNAQSFCKFIQNSVFSIIRLPRLAIGVLFWFNCSLFHLFVFLFWLLFLLAVGYWLKSSPFDRLRDRNFNSRSHLIHCSLFSVLTYSFCLDAKK